MERRYVAGIAAIGAAAGYIQLARRRQLDWGATGHETTEPLSGDHFVATPDLVATRAITVHTGADLVWPWIAQLGQGRGGFYSTTPSRTCSDVTSTALIASLASGRTSSLGTR